MDDFYRENILDHYRNPRNHGHLEAPTATAEGVNPLCGDELRVELDIDAGVVRDVRFNGRGCAISQAAASMIPDGGVKIVQSGSLFVGVYRIGERLYAIEDRCSHDDGPLCEGEREGYEV